MRLGDLDLDDDVDDGASPLDVRVEKTIPHTGYRPSNKVNDIAIVKLQKSVSFSSKYCYWWNLELIIVGDQLISNNYQLDLIMWKYVVQYMNVNIVVSEPISDLLTCVVDSSEDA